MSMLTCGDAPRRKALAIAHAIDVVDDRYFGITRQQEVGVQGMRRPAFNSAHRGHQCLSNHLAAKYALPADLRRAAAEQVHFQRFEIENVEQILDGGGHEAARNRSKSVLNLLCCGEIYKECA